MCAYNLHFGCRIKNQANAKLTRENYAEITDASRKNSFINDRSYFKEASVEKANEKYWNKIKNYVFNQYAYEISKYKELLIDLNDPDNGSKLLDSLIKQEIDERIRQEKSSNRVFYIESQDPDKQKLGKKYATVLKRNKLLERDDETVKNRFRKYQADLKAIQEYDITHICYIKAPNILKKWYKENHKTNVSLDIPKEWIKEYYLEKAPYYTDKKCKRLQEDALKNFDNNMIYFNSLDSEEFNNEIDSFLKLHPTFEYVDDLRKYDGIAGVYIMVLDEYKQIYIGVSRSKRGIKGRIQTHWSTIKPLDRLIWGSVEYSIMSIDSFRAYDTTRIYVEPHPEFKEQIFCENGEPQKRVFLGVECNVWGIDEYLSSKEFELVKNAFSQKFLCNRCAGGGKSIANAVASVQGHDICETSQSKLEATKNNLHNLK